MRYIADNSKCLIPDSSTGQHPSNVYKKKRTDVKFHIDFLTKGIRQSPYVSRRQ